jgi:hypothetical protein
MNRLLRSPRIIITVLAVATFAALTMIAHHSAGANSAAQPLTRTTAGPAQPSAAASPDEQIEPTDEGVATDPSPSPATIVAGDTDPKTFAITFMTRYMNTQGKRPDEWEATWNNMITPELADLLTDVDPSSAPAGRVHDADVKVLLEGDALVSVTVPVPNEGIATLTLTGASRQWLVSQLDWAKTP